MGLTPVISDVGFTIEGYPNVEVLTGSFDALDAELTDFLGYLFIDFILMLIMNIRYDLAAIFPATLSEGVFHKHGPLLTDQRTC